MSLIDRVAALIRRFGKPHRAVWISAGPEEPVKLIEIIVQPFASEQAAQQLWQEQVPDLAVLATLIDPPPHAEGLNSEISLEWQRGPVYFTEIAGQYDRATIDVLAACTAA